MLATHPWPARWPFGWPDFAVCLGSHALVRWHGGCTFNALLVVLGTREFVVDAELEARILEQRDADQLETWLRRAATASTLEDVFEG